MRGKLVYLILLVNSAVAFAAPRVTVIVNGEQIRCERYFESAGLSDAQLSFSLQSFLLSVTSELEDIQIEGIPKFVAKPVVAAIKHKIKKEADRGKVQAELNRAPGADGEPGHFDLEFSSGAQGPVLKLDLQYQAESLAHNMVEPFQSKLDQPLQFAATLPVRRDLELPIRFITGDWEAFLAGGVVSFSVDSAALDRAINTELSEQILSSILSAVTELVRAKFPIQNNQPQAQVQWVQVQPPVFEGTRQQLMLRGGLYKLRVVARY